MKKTLLNIRYKSFLNLLLIFILPYVAVSQNNLKVESSATSVSYDENFALNVLLDNSEDVSALQLDILYDSSSFKYQESYTASNIDGFDIGVNIIQPGLLRIIIYSTDNSLLNAGLGNFLSLDFISRFEPGDFDFTITDAVLSDASSNQLAVTTENGNTKVLGPKFVLTDSSLAFGDIPMLSDQQGSIRISNQGNAELIINQVSINSPFSVLDQIPISIAPGSTHNIQIDVDTSAKQQIIETCSFITNDTSSLRALQKTEVSATIFAVNEIYIGTGSGPINTPITIPVTIENMEAFNGFQFDVTLPDGFTYVEASLSLSGRETDHSVSANMLDTSTLRLLSYSQSNSNFTGTDGEVLSFQVIGNVNSGTFPLPIASSIISNAVLGNIESDSYAGSVDIDSPYLTLSQSTYNLGRVPVNEIREMNLRFTNTGQANLIIDEILYNADELSSDIPIPWELTPYESSDRIVKFSPNELGDFQKSLSIRHNASDGQSIVSITADVFSPNYLKLIDTYTSPNTTFSVPVELSNLEDIRGIQFDIEIPGGFNFSTGDIALDTSLSNFNVSSSSLGNDVYRVIIYTTGDAVIPSGTTTLLSMTLGTEEQTALGQYEFPISNVVLSNLSNQNVASEALGQGYVFVVESTAPVASDQNATTKEDTALDITLSADDIDNDPLTFYIDQQPTSGTIALTDNVVTYTPDENFYGSDSFTFYASDGVENSNIATVSLAVNPVNDAPVATDQNATTDEDTALDITLSATDIDNDPLTFVIDQQPTNGTVTLTNNVVTYTPNENFNGSDSFTFYASDGVENSSIAKVYIEVEATLGVEHYQKNDIKVYPNPFSGYLTVELHEAEEISVFDLKGRLLKTYITENTVNHLQLDVLPDGVYILSIKRNNQFINKKIIKQNR